MCIPKVQCIHVMYTHIAAREGCSWQLTQLPCKPAPLKDIQYIMLPKVHTFCSDDGVMKQCLHKQCLLLSNPAGKSPAQKAVPMPKGTVAPQGLAGNCISGM